MLYPLGTLHYARGMAYVGIGSPHQARKELEVLDNLGNSPQLEPLRIWEINKVTDILAIASDVLAGEIAAYRGKTDKAIHHLAAGVDKEMNLLFDEPPPWCFPVREALGQVLLEAVYLDRAKEVFRKDLLKNSENPWSLYGLALTMKKQGNSDLELETLKRFRKAWSRADVEMKGLVLSRMTAN